MTNTRLFCGETRLEAVRVQPQRAITPDLGAVSDSRTASVICSIHEQLQVGQGRFGFGEHPL